MVDVHGREYDFSFTIPNWSGRHSLFLYTKLVKFTKPYGDKSSKSTYIFQYWGRSDDLMDNDDGFAENMQMMIKFKSGNMVIMSRISQPHPEGTCARHWQRGDEELGKRMMEEFTTYEAEKAIFYTEPINEHDEQ